MASSSCSSSDGCLGCGKQEKDDGSPLFKCSQCSIARYCSPACQKAHWKQQHKHECCDVPLVDQFWSFVEQAKKDNAITTDEYKYMRLTVNRIAGLKNLQRSDKSTEDPETNMKIAVLCMMDHRLLDVGRGVQLANLSKSKKRYEGYVAYVEHAIGGSAGPFRTYKVKLGDGSSTILQLRPNQLRIISLNDPRHWNKGLQFSNNPEQVFDPQADAEWCNRQRLYIPVTPGYKWQYLDVDGEWKDYNEHVQYDIETLYDMGCQHCLYRPGAPHAEGMPIYMNSIPSTDPRDPFVGDVWFLNHHDASTRQIVFKELSEENRHTTTMTERDLYTGMRRPVRRLGPLPPPENNYMQERNMCGSEYHFKDNAQNDGSFCGLCYSTIGPFTQTECCGQWVCDTEDSYEIGSYDRDGQCMRNHRLGSICAFHHQESHACDDWKDCQECINSFHPYDYAVKASSQAKSGTNRRYNFDNNVRHDLDLTTIEFPTCCECHEPIDTTEELTRTLRFRLSAMGGGKTFCKYHGGGFGVTKTDPNFQQGGDILG